jgi:hypothetical protein
VPQTGSPAPILYHRNQQPEGTTLIISA